MSNDSAPRVDFHDLMDVIKEHAPGAFFNRIPHATDELRQFADYHADEFPGMGGALRALADRTDSDDVRRRRNEYRRPM